MKKILQYCCLESVPPKNLSMLSARARVVGSKRAILYKIFAIFLYIFLYMNFAKLIEIISHTNFAKSLLL